MQATREVFLIETLRNVLDQCADPPSISFGVYTPSQKLYDIGDTVTYICDGALEEKGNRENMCLANGIWSLDPMKNNLPMCCKCCSFLIRLSKMHQHDLA